MVMTSSHGGGGGDGGGTGGAGGGVTGAGGGGDVIPTAMSPSLFHLGELQYSHTGASVGHWLYSNFSVMIPPLL
jgi:hypothetical protein